MATSANTTARPRYYRHYVTKHYTGRSGAGGRDSDLLRGGFAVDSLMILIHFDAATTTRTSTVNDVFGIVI